MYDINKILEILKKYVNSKAVLEPPTKAEIIDKLCTIGVDNPGVDNTDSVLKIVKSVINSVKKYESFIKSKGKDPNIRFISAISGGYHIVNMFFEQEVPSSLEGINIYIPVKGDKLLNVIPFIYKHLISNKISFSSKISMFNRTDNLIVAVYNKEDAISLINFCNNKFASELGIINPFISKLGNVGVSREMYYLSYNLAVATLLNEYIEDCILSQRVKPYDAIDFQNFVNEKYSNADNYLDKNMYYIVSISLYCILTNILKYLKSDIEIVFDYDNYYRYEVVNLSGDNEYLYSGKVINKETDYLCFVKLQALNCLNLISEEQYGKESYQEQKAEFTQRYKDIMKNTVFIPYITLEHLEKFIIFIKLKYGNEEAETKFPQEIKLLNRLTNVKQGIMLEYTTRLIEEVKSIIPNHEGIEEILKRCLEDKTNTTLNNILLHLTPHN